VFWLDSPGVPPSATAHELFRGFSYIAPSLLDEKAGVQKVDSQSTQSLSMVIYVALCLYRMKILDCTFIVVVSLSCFEAP